jgi:hypothetical protein
MDLELAAPGVLKEEVKSEELPPHRIISDHKL